MRYYDDWSTAARASLFGKAVSDRIRRELDGGRVLELEIIKPLHGEPYVVYASAPGIRCHTYKLTPRDIDTMRKWHAWN